MNKQSLDPPQKTANLPKRQLSFQGLQINFKFFSIGLKRKMEEVPHFSMIEIH